MTPTCDYGQCTEAIELSGGFGFCPNHENYLKEIVANAESGDEDILAALQVCLSTVSGKVKKLVIH